MDDPFAGESELTNQRSANTVSLNSATKLATTGLLARLMGAGDGSGVLGAPGGRGSTTPNRLAQRGVTMAITTDEPAYEIKR